MSSRRLAERLGFVADLTTAGTRQPTAGERHRDLSTGRFGIAPSLTLNGAGHHDLPALRPAPSADELERQHSQQLGAFLGQKRQEPRSSW